MTGTESPHDPSDPPTEDPRPDQLRTVPSLVLVNTGDGKGKSSAAFGVVVRALARGWRVAVVQFLKSGGWNTGEEKIGRQLGVDWWTIGEGFTWESDDLSRDEAVARESWAQARALIQAGEHQLVILDEITYPMTWGWISTAEVVEVIANRPPDVSVVATGRDAPQELIEAADLVSEVVKIKHPMDQGIRAQQGIEW